VEEVERLAGELLRRGSAHGAVVLQRADGRVVSVDNAVAARGEVGRVVPGRRELVHELAGETERLADL
jgi:hypothetical protein